MKVIYIATVLFVSFFLFTACGGEDCVGAECFEPTDETSVTDDEEVADDTTDETVDETADEVVDEEPDIEIPDEGNVKEICVNFLEFEGNWSTVQPTDVSGNFTLKLSVEGNECVISVTGKWKFEWRGNEIPLPCAEYAPASYFFYLVGMEGEKMVWIKGWDETSCKDAEAAPIYKFEKNSRR